MNNREKEALDRHITGNYGEDQFDVCNHTPDNSWWESDARGIPIARVCDNCRDDVLAKYRPEVLTDSNYESDEPIEPEDY